MKRVIPFLILICLLLTACAAAPENEKAVALGLVIDREAQTITHGGDIYHYVIEMRSGSVDYLITYPNGASYFWNQSGNTGGGGGSSSYDESRYLPGTVLVDVLKAEPFQKAVGIQRIAALLLAALGVWNLLAPRSAWYLTGGWRYANAQPSKLALIAAKFGGAALVLFGIMVFFL